MHDKLRVGTYTVADATPPQILPDVEAGAQASATIQVSLESNGGAFHAEAFISALGDELDIATEHINILDMPERGVTIRLRMPLWAAEKLHDMVEASKAARESLWEVIKSSIPKTRGDWAQIIAAFGYVGVSFALYFILDPLLSDPDQTKEYIRAAGIWGPVVYMTVYSIQVFIPFLPGVSMDAVAGALWGVGGTIILSVASATIAGLVIIPGVRWLGLQTIDEKFPALLKGPWRFVRIAEKWPWTLAIVATLGGDASYFVAGATRVPLWKSLVVIGVARLPAVIAYSLVGWAVDTGRAATSITEQFSKLVPLFSVVTIVSLLIGVTILARYGNRIIDRLEEVLEGKNSGAD